LEEKEIAIIQEWVHAGAPEGATHPFPNPPSYPEGSQLEQPDLVIEVQDSVLIPGDNTDHFYLVKAPFEIPVSRLVKTIEFVPGNRRLAHHMNGHLVNFDFDKKQNIYEGVTWINPENQDVNSNNAQLGLLHDDGSYPTLTPNVSSY
jgi:hypothetical protein